jgi:hypothetical protein
VKQAIHVLPDVPTILQMADGDAEGKAIYWQVCLPTVV